MFIDTHAHLWWPSYSEDLDRVIERARTAGVTQFIVPGTDLDTSCQAVELAKKYPGIIYAAVGIHPEETVAAKGSELEQIRLLIAQNRRLIVAVGEIGTDANTQELREQMGQQQELFREQCMVATQYDLPIIVHTRNSFTETMAVLDKLKVVPRGQFHCFSYGEKEWTEVVRRGYYVSFAGNISWSKRLQRIVSQVPIERLLMETDSPLMLPRDKMGNTREVENGMNGRNEPINVIMLAQIQAELRTMSLEKFGEATCDNTRKLFNITRN